MPPVCDVCGCGPDDVARYCTPVCCYGRTDHYELHWDKIYPRADRSWRPYHTHDDEDNPGWDDAVRCLEGD